MFIQEYEDEGSELVFWEENGQVKILVKTFCIHYTLKKKKKKKKKQPWIK